LRSNGQRWMNSLALTTRTVGDAEGADSQLALVGRAAFLALTGQDYNVHVGASGTWVFHPPDSGSGGTTGGRHTLRFRDRPELRVDSTRLIDTGPIDAHRAHNIGLELAGNWRNFYLQGEHFWYGIDRRGSGLDDPSFDAFYVQAGWFLTGESRRYNMATGSFQMPRPFVPVAWPWGYGAWEIALRYSNTDLDFHAGDRGTLAGPDAVRGGVQDIWTVGLNWYLNANLRMSLNYYHVDVDRLNPASLANPTPFGAAPNTPPTGVQIGQEYDVIGLRTQFGF
jgi:phosphate-selective porin OprO/OprP